MRVQSKTFKIKRKYNKNTRSNKRNRLYKKGGGKHRVAFLFSGRINAYEYVKENLLKLKDKYNATFFASINKSSITPYIQSFFDILSFLLKYFFKILFLYILFYTSIKSICLLLYIL